MSNLTLLDIANITSSEPIRGPLSGLFDGIDFGFHSRSFYQLITALIAFLAISLVVVAAIIIFRCYMIYCKSYANTTVYQLPVYQRTVRQPRRLTRRRKKAFFWRRTSRQNNPDIRETYTFKAIFDDPEEEDQ